MRTAILNAGDTLQNEIFGGDGAGLVKAAHVDPAGVRNPERLGAENSYAIIQLEHIAERRKYETYRIWTARPTMH